MNPKLFMDTNIIIDFIEQRPYEIDSTNKLFRAAEENLVEVYICESTVVNTWYITGLDGQILKLLPLVHLLQTQTRIIERALLSSFKDKEDAVLYFTALENKMDYFITRDEKDFKKHILRDLKTLSPKALVKHLEF
jgi:predicted nucleic acid-binding protein